MKRIKYYLAAFSLLLSLGGATLVPMAAVSADSATGTVCSTLGSSSNCGSTPSGSVPLDNVVTAVVNILSLIVGIASVIMIIVSGLRMITGGSDSSTVASARSGIIYAIIGLLIALLSQAIVRFVLNKVGAK